MNKKIITDLGMLLRCSLPISRETLSVDETRELWETYDPSHKTAKPQSKKFTDFQYFSFRVTYKNIFTDRINVINFLGKVPHAFFIGQEMYGKPEIYPLT